MPELRPILIDLPEQIIGDRVVVRPWRDSDAEPLFQLIVASRAHIRQWLPWADSHRTVADTRAYVRQSAANWAAREDMGLAILDHGGQILGGTGLHPRDWRVPAFEIGYWIGASHQGKGYVSEAVHLVTDLAFDVLQAQRVVIRCDARNVRSAAVARRCGYTHEGTFHADSIGADGSLRDTMFFARLASER